MPGDGIAVLLNVPRFLPNASQFGERAAFSRQKASHPWIAALKDAALYQTAYCGAAIKVWRVFAVKVRYFLWEKSGSNAAMFSSAAATCWTM